MSEKVLSFNFDTGNVVEQVGKNLLTKKVKENIELVNDEDTETEDGIEEEVEPIQQEEILAFLTSFGMVSFFHHPGYTACEHGLFSGIPRNALYLVAALDGKQNHVHEKSGNPNQGRFFAVAPKNFPLLLWYFFSRSAKSSLSGSNAGNKRIEGVLKSTVSL